MIRKYGRLVLQHKESRAGLALGLLLLILLAGGSAFYAGDPRATSLDIFAPPSAGYWLGTNDVGQDIFNRLLAGGRSSLTVALGAGGLATFLAVSLGAWAALAGGWTDRIIMRIVDILLVIPNIVIIILVSAYFRPSLFLEILFISLLGWLEGSRMIRVQILSLQERTHVYAARLFGAGRGYIFHRHLLPELIPLMLSLFLQGARRAVFIEVGLAFVGVADPNLISLGSMISQALNYYYLEVWHWWLLPSAGLLSLTLFSLTLVGYGLEEALMTDPRRKTHAGNS